MSLTGIYSIATKVTNKHKAYNPPYPLGYCGNICTPTITNQCTGDIHTTNYCGNICTPTITNQCTGDIHTTNYCTRCGKNNLSDVIFCPQCGKEIRREPNASNCP
jgi:hypothetical protein